MKSKLIEETQIDSDGFWIYLKPGFRAAEKNFEHLIHEDTKAKAYDRLREVVVCHCDDCKKQYNKGE